MNKNQDILKKYFEVQIKKIPARNGLMLLPLRIETRFAENRKVIVQNQPDSVLFIFMELWQMADEGVSIEKMQRILRMMEDLDVVYAQDCRYLKEIIESIPDSLGKSDRTEIRSPGAGILSTGKRISAAGDITEISHAFPQGSCLCPAFS